ncbi:MULTISPECIES: hydroxyacid dehydrogenase [unclassified Acidocella]|uniref:hydroxyacid dehydrogenase n=1 Tax=unclassified Acidocella TaxID=2648610 RepID=UPI00028CD040|nr:MULTISPECIES: hydroxyacid dehydrogenase [unclassified Acidocella]EKM98378.1 D-3-phosphoglycerate dehydrogenase [Acidocella sp. MX-AZ02]WBO59286.1 hydroxyacid dehydrogenase [Acidocella sp. MX-AZ03]
MAQIVITEFMDDEAVRALAARGQVLYRPDLVDQPEALAAALEDCQALIVRNRTQVRGALLAQAPKLELVGRLGVGLDNIDLEACKARKIAVYPATGANDDAVAEYVACATLSLLRRGFLRSVEVAAGLWPREAMIGREISGRRAGMVGFGGTARQAAARLAALGMRIAAYDPLLPEGHAAWGTAQRMSLEDLFASCDVVSLHVPLTPQTRHMIDAGKLALMQSHAVLINAARGGVVDEAALVAALKAGALGGAALDVFEHEPLDGPHGALFAGVPNLILTPHIAGVTMESNVRVSGKIAEIVLNALKIG